MDSAPGVAILRSLNEAQCRAVTSTSSTVAILAGPGSGKTHTLTARVVWLLDVARYAPENVIVATFTVKAAREMKERIGKALGNGRERKLVLGTFHSIARRYLSAYGKRIGLDQKFGIADSSDSIAIVSRICKRLQLSVDPPVARAWISKKKAKGTDNEAPKKRPGGANQKQSETSKDLEACFAEYQDHLQRSNLLDYDDLLVKCVELLKNFPSCVSNVQSVLIDEYQDTNGVQYELMRLFAQKHRSVTIVGDPDQSIYGWRSAEIGNLYRLLGDYPGTDEVALEKNYRSSQHILDLSLKVVQQDEKRYQKILHPVHNKGTRPVLRVLKTSAKEAEWIVSEVRRALMRTGTMMTHDDIAILLRSAALSRHIESALGKSGIPYRMVGGFKFYERAEIKIILDYLRIIHQSDNNDALARIINVPRRGIGEGTVKSWLEESESSSVSLWKFVDQCCRGDRKAKANIKMAAEQKLSGGLLRLIKDMRKQLNEAGPAAPFTLVDLINQVLTRTKFQKFLQDAYCEDYEGRWANVQEFVNLATDFMRDLGQADEELPDIDDLEQVRETDVLAKFLANVSLASDVQKDGGDQENKPMVTISTIHAAKGLEWPIVFVPSAYYGSIPHSRSEDVDEERRLLYVAMTRAKALLYLSYPLYSAHGNGERLELSPFLSPISQYFAKQGPSFQPQALRDMGMILDREVPADAEIFKAMPLQAHQEDDQFPIDPEETRWDQLNDSAASSGASRSKRPRIHGPGSGEGGEGWRKEYTTTMEQASTFTVSSLPGFVTAGAHQSALVAAPPPANKAVERKATAAPIAVKRSAGQSTLSSFFKPGSAAKPGASGGLVPDRAGTPKTPPAAWKSSTRPVFIPSSRSIPAPPSIEPGLLNHRLGQVQVKHRLPLSDGASGAKRKYYAQFSGPPNRPSEDDQTRNDDQKMETGLKTVQPAATSHRTTVAMATSLSALKKSAGPGQLGMTPVDRLRKPFKPLTINRF